MDRVNWYVACLEDVIARKVVRGLAEAEAGFDAAIDETVRELERLRGLEEQLEAAQGRIAATDKLIELQIAMHEIDDEAVIVRLLESIRDCLAPIPASRRKS